MRAHLRKHVAGRAARAKGRTHPAPVECEPRFRRRRRHKVVASSHRRPPVRRLPSAPCMPSAHILDEQLQAMRVQWHRRRRPLRAGARLRPEGGGWGSPHAHSYKSGQQGAHRGPGGAPRGRVDGFVVRMYQCGAYEWRPGGAEGTWEAPGSGAQEGRGDVLARPAGRPAQQPPGSRPALPAFLPARLRRGSQS